MDIGKDYGEYIMKLSEMKNKVTGLPEGFTGARKKWDEVKEVFEIVKAAVLERDKVGEDGQVIKFSKGPREGQTVPDRQVCFQIRTSDGKDVIVRTNSPRLTSLYTGDLDRDPDSVNQFGDRIFLVDVPEGKMHFVPYEIEGKDKSGKSMRWNVADLEEVED